LKKAPLKVILIDRSNHHLFQPLLYQVATSVLAPAQIGSPIRGILKSSENTTVILGSVTGVDDLPRRTDETNYINMCIKYEVLQIALLLCL